MSDKTNVHFQKLTDDEKTSKLSQLARSGGELLVWVKGSKERQSITSFEIKDLALHCKTSTKLENNQVLFSFQLNGLSFFGTAELAVVNSNHVVLNCEGELFKSERRTNFRLLTFPHHKVFLSFNVDQEELVEGNVIGMKLGMSETGLFKKFLSLVDDEASSENAFRVLDLSVTGASFQVGEIESKFFKMDTNFEDVSLSFNGKNLVIPGAKVIYNVEMISNVKNSQLYKVGVHFTGVDLNLDQKLGSLINSVLRDFETEFEDFVK